ncbi:hypothetical protein BH24ACT1_BH24ACT1_08770 [soil metagenome]
MNVAARLAVFALAVTVVFGTAVAAGRAVDPVHDEVADTMADTMGDMVGSDHGEADHPDVEGGGHEEMAGQGPSSVGGLSVVDDELRMEVDDPVLAAGASRPFSFRIFEASGDVVTDFDPEQGGVELHLVVVNRDLSGFQHLHPQMGPDGTWSIPLALASPGASRAFVDVTVDGRPHTLGVDLFAPGEFTPQPLPAPSVTATVEGYEVRFASPDLVAGEQIELSFSVERDGVPVTDLEPYLGARGHLVGLRQGDLAYLHLHPEEAAEDNTIVFAGSFPSPGTYRLFLQFQHQGVVRTVPLTMEVLR